MGIMCASKAFLQLLMYSGVLWVPAPCFPVKRGPGHSIRAPSSPCLGLVTAECGAVHP